MVGAAALVPLVLLRVLVGFAGFNPVAGVVFTLAAQFVLAVGTGVVLIYVVARANHLADE